MKATNKQYKKAVKLYEDGGATAVYDYAKEIGINEWSTCEPCETETPDCEDGACLVCGTFRKQESSQLKITLKDRLKVATKKQLQECLNLLEFRQVGKKSFSLPYKLKDIGNAKGSFSANVTLSNGCILIGVKEYSDHVSLDNLGFPILVERCEGSLYLRVWNDINEEDVTHHINMDGARNEYRIGNE